MDTEILLLLNGLLGQFNALDNFMAHLAENPVFKGLPPMIAFWLLWFRTDEETGKRRGQLLGCLAVATFALLAARTLSVFAPYRPRPLHIPEIALVDPFDLSGNYLSGWSAFPSDHAALFFSIAVSFWLIDRRIGKLALAHALLVVLVPRIIIGLHWPSDIIAGAILGAAIAAVALPVLARRASHSGWANLADHKAELFYPFMFLVTFQVATMFESARLTFSALVAVIGL
ncbi:MAG: phosphatase PAP2 family protein [Paracoccaceae bacterium]